METEEILTEVKRIISMPICKVSEHDSLLEKISEAMKINKEDMKSLKNAQEKIIENRGFRENQTPLGLTAKEMW